MKFRFHRFMMMLFLSAGALSLNADTFEEIMDFNARKLMQLTGVSTNLAVSAKGRGGTPKIARESVPEQLNVGDCRLIVTRRPKSKGYSWRCLEDLRYRGDIYVSRWPSHEDAVTEAFTIIATNSTMPLDGLAQCTPIAYAGDKYLRISARTRHYVIVDDYLILVSVLTKNGVRKEERKIVPERLADAVLAALTAEQ